MKCQGTNKEGLPCRTPGRMIDPLSGYCFRHNPNNKKRAHLASKLGGIASVRQRRPGGLPSSELGDLRSVRDAQRWLITITMAVGERRLSHSEASAMTRAVSEWIRAEDTRLRSEDLCELKDKIRVLQERSAP